MQIVIVGANFGNKGAQSMLFTTVAALRRKYPDAKIFFAHANKSPCLNDAFTFDEIYFNKYHCEVTATQVKLTTVAPWCPAEKTIRAFKAADLIVDVSGFALGSKWGANASFAYLNMINFVRALNVPMILMPQSFGGFEFGDAQKFMDAQIADVMTYPEKIFAREVDGYVPLRERYGLRNVSLHPDIVLSSETVKPADIYKDPPKITVPKVLDASCVGVVPNLRSFDRGGNPWQVLQTFYELINFLLKSGKIVYLFRHSVEDIRPCTWLKLLFADDGRVVLWQNDFSCFEYDEVCKQFDFLIVGRFHGVVHAYRNNVPCVLLGWAVKYRELAQLMYQTRYVFDVAAPEVDTREIFAAIDDMSNNLASNKKILRERLAQIQRGSSCFSAVEDILNASGGRAQ